LIGVGLGSFPTYSPKLVGIPVTPHNDFIRVFAEMGIVGLIPYLWLWGTLAWGLYRLWRRTPDRPQALVAASLIAIAACYFVSSLSADLLNYPTLGWVFWSLMALPEAFRQQPEMTA
jgi:O-antigen ligase